MTPATIIREAQANGVRLALSPTGNIKATGDGAAVDKWLPSLREHKADIVDELHRARRYDHALSMLADGRRYAVIVEDASTDPVIATVAIRNLAVFELAIPARYYDGVVLMELLEKHSTEIVTA
jgi:hypothetical protein